MSRYTPTCGTKSWTSFSQLFQWYLWHFSTIFFDWPSFSNGVLGCLMASPFANVLIYHELTNKLNFQLHWRSEQKPAFNYQWSALLHAAVSCNFQAEELSTACQSIGYKLMCIMRTSAKVMFQTLLTKHRTTDGLKTISICPEIVRTKKMP